MATLQEMAAYRPSPLATAANMLTGGLLGAITGQNQRERDALLARRQLIEEAALERRMNMKRQIELAQQIQDEERARRIAQEERVAAAERETQAAMGGTQAYAGAPTDETGMSPFFALGYRKGQEQTAIAEKERVAAAGRQEQEAIGGMMGVSGAPVDMGSASPYFRAGQVRAQFEQAKEEEKRAAEERRNMPRNIAAMLQAGLPVKKNITPAEAEAGALFASQAFSMNKSAEQAAAENRAFLEAEGVSVPPDATPAQIAALTRQRIANRPTAEMRNVEEGQRLVQAIQDEPDQEKQRKMYDKLPRQFKSDALAGELGIPIKMPAKFRQELDSKMQSMDRAIDLVSSIQTFAKGKDVREVSKQSINSLLAGVRDRKSSIFGSNDERFAINDIVQEFEGLVSGERKTLFGASLTDNELATARRIFADPNSADFLPRALRFMDSVFRADPAENAKGYIGSQSYSKMYEDKVGRYDSIRNTIDGLPQRPRRKAQVQPAPAAGATNAPAGAQSEIPEVIRGQDGQLRYK